jgi:hypothetical protein
VTGKIQFQATFLAARMLMVRTQMELKKAGDKPDAVRKCAEQLRQLFAQNAECGTVQQDLAKLFG